ncbi:hypothetical protein [Aeromonas veronii]|uniref:hypothetical protein n=1 Tax=Aeromonas veronii TaxID=654 RepID=UPI003D1AB04D
MLNGEAIYNISNFSSLFEVAIGLNLVFSLWESLRNTASSKFTKISDDLAVELKALLGDEFEDSRCSMNFETKKDKYLLKLQRFSDIAKWIGLASTVILISVLIQTGLEPEYKITEKQLYLLLLISIGFTPLFITIGNIYVWYCKGKLIDFKEQQSIAFEDMKAVLTK